MNVIVLVIDTLRYDHVRANGNREIRTPNLDRVAERGWNFSRAFAASFPTIPHRTDTLTGRYGGPFHPWAPLDCDVQTLPEVLSNRGYLTQLIHDSPHLVNGGHRFDLPFHTWTQIRGAETDRAWFTDSWELLDNWEWDPVFDGLGAGRDVGDVIRNSGHQLPRYLHNNLDRASEEDWNTARLFEAASKFLGDNASRDNFFLWLDCFDPHEPWDAPPEYVKMYDDTPGYHGTIDPRALTEVQNHADLPEAGRDRIAAAYKAKVTFMDRCLGSFLDTLDETGLAENTAVVVAGDHGTNLADAPDRGFGKFDPPRQNEAHVPLFVDVPGGGSGHCDAIVQPQDVFATVAAIADAAVPETIDSQDVLAIARGERTPRRQVALSGTAVETVGRTPWGVRDQDDVLFSVFDGDWSLAFAPEIDACKLRAIGSFEEVSDDNPAVVERLYEAALDELDRRGLDRAISQWLRQGDDRGSFPSEYQATSSNPVPQGWRRYWYHEMHE